MRKFLPVAVVLSLCAACQAYPDPSGRLAPRAKAIPWFTVPMVSDAWSYVDFGSNGGVELADEVLVIHHGERLEGVRYAGRPADLLGDALDGYEIKLEAQRTGGHDIFLGMTFPVGQKESASLVLGGWGGAVCGLSSVDDQDASGNAWKSIHPFEDNRWYAVTVRVDAKEVAATLDGKPLFAVPRAGHRFGLRAEVEPTGPLGFFTFGTSARVRNIAVRQLK